MHPLFEVTCSMLQLPTGAKRVRDRLADTDLPVIKCPGNSPDLNPTENSRAHINNNPRDKNIRTEM